LSYDAISPIDGRYRVEAEALSRYFSDRALASERVRVEVAYLRLLMKLGVAPRKRIPPVDIDMQELKKLEEDLGHDVKAVEIYLRKRLGRSKAKGLVPYVHLGLTSEDTNSLAFALLLKSAKDRVLVPAYAGLATQLAEIAAREADTPMTARTHGRPAVPTTFGKEMAVFAVRLAERARYLRGLVPQAKFSGAVGTYASFGLLAKIDWPRELSAFVSGLGVESAGYSTQVVPGERLSDILHAVINLNQLMVSLSRDLWFYQTLDFVHFQRPGRVSSSTMPQKVNPVDLENAEGQAEVSNSLLLMQAYRLQYTRMQRDLSDSAIRRTIGQALAHSLVASSRLRVSLLAMRVERQVLHDDFERHPEIFAEREQILRRLSGDELGYEKVKSAMETGVFVPPIPPDRYLGRAAELAAHCPGAVRELLRSPPGSRGGSPRRSRQ
jgi:adenylosuccinate lyase